MNPLTATTLLFGGCCTDVVFLELLITNDPGSGSIITFAHFLFIAFEGFIFTSDFGRKKPHVPLKDYTTLVIYVFVSSVLNNLVLNFNISMPLHMIFRSGSLIASLLLGKYLMKKQYSLSKYISVIMITFGVAACTIESSKYIARTGYSTNAGDDESSSIYDLMIWGTGVALLTLSLFLSARMGLYQESLSLAYGKHPKEALFYSHALPLPAFLILSKDIYGHFLIFNESSPVVIPYTQISVPIMWLHLLVNVVMNYVCSISAFMLSAECSSLTVTLAVTLRKFTSLMLSIWYFQNPFTAVHWFGTLLVFIGTIIFTEVINLYKIQKALFSSGVDTSKKVD